MVVANSGTPFNITTGSDLTGNNQFNARPTYAASCAEPTAVATRWGCLDVWPYGAENPSSNTPIEPYAAGEKIVPYGLGTGPANISLNLRLSKVLGFGPKVESRRSGGGGGGGNGGGGGYRGSRQGLNGGLSGTQGGQGRIGQTVPRRYNLTLSLWGTNILNHENLGTPNGALSPSGLPGALVPQPLFGESQTLAGGFFASPTAGNRNVSLQATFTF
jgi:hypothetical protein